MSYYDRGRRNPRRVVRGPVLKPLLSGHEATMANAIRGNERLVWRIVLLFSSFFWPFFSLLGAYSAWRVAKTLGSSGGWWAFLGFLAPCIPLIGTLTAEDRNYNREL